MPSSGPPQPPPPPPFGGAPGRFGGTALPPPEASFADTPPPARRTRGPVFWMGAGCLGCLGSVVLLVAAIGGAGLYLTRGPVDAVQHQIREIRSGDMPAAYERLADGYKERFTQKDFEAFVATHPALRDNAASFFWERSIDNDKARVVGRLTASDGRTENVRYGLLRQEGKWKIEEIVIEEAR